MAEDREGEANRISEQLGLEWCGLEEVRTEAMRFASSKLAILIEGQTGTGKELVARFIHEFSDRSSKKFVPVNCAALPETLLDSELFGHTKGAFTGATKSRRGLIEVADGGTLFLDEINSAPSSLQGKLLRVLQDGEVRPVGSNADVATDIRLICATNADLRLAMQEGRLREDLYYRISKVRIILPPLRERGAEAIRRLAAGFATHEGTPCEITSDSYCLLEVHPWPGNARELRGAVEAAVVRSGGGALHPRHFRLDRSRRGTQAPDSAPSHPAGEPSGRDAGTVSDTLDPEVLTAARSLWAFRELRPPIRDAAMRLAQHMVSALQTDGDGVRRQLFPTSPSLGIPEEWPGHDVVAFALAIVVKADLAEDERASAGIGPALLEAMYGNRGFSRGAKMDSLKTSVVNHLKAPPRSPIGPSSGSPPPDSW